MGEASLPDPKQQKMVSATLPFFILLPSLVAQNIKYKVPKYKADFLSHDATGEKDRSTSCSSEKSSSSSTFFESAVT